MFAGGGDLHIHHAPPFQERDVLLDALHVAALRINPVFLMSIPLPGIFYVIALKAIVRKSCKQLMIVFFFEPVRMKKSSRFTTCHVHATRAREVPCLTTKMLPEARHEMTQSACDVTHCRYLVSLCRIPRRSCRRFSRSPRTTCDPCRKHRRPSQLRTSALAFVFGC